MKCKTNPKERTVKVTDWEHYTRCDFCKEKILEKVYERADVDISAWIGDSYPEGDFSTEYKVDCCKNCFLNKVIPTLEEKFNIRFKEREHGEDTQVEIE